VPLVATPEVPLVATPEVLLVLWVPVEPEVLEVEVWVPVEPEVLEVVLDEVEVWVPVEPEVLLVLEVLLVAPEPEVDEVEPELLLELVLPPVLPLPDPVPAPLKPVVDEPLLLPHAAIATHNAAHKLIF
jgi:hypothetical protein